MRRSATSCAASLAKAGTRTLTDDMVPGTRWVKLTELVENIDEAVAVMEAGRHARWSVHFTTPQTPSQIAMLALCCKISSAARGRLQRLAAHDILHRGEARRKRLQLRTKSTKTRSSPRQFWNSRSRSSILNGAPVRQLAMHWATGEQWLLPLLHSSRGAWLKPCPWLGTELG